MGLRCIYLVPDNVKLTIMPMTRFASALILIFSACVSSKAQNIIVNESNYTSVKIRIPEKEALINPMIYGQMLEDCNDNVIYGGIVDNAGKENEQVTELLRPLSIPVMRWPGGTAIYDYEWEKGIGESREATRETIWNGTEYYTFGTDEFISWCHKLEIEPYINIPMGNNNTYRHSLGNALNWIEYVNGSAETSYGALRAKNGHAEPYNVKFWCIGNENYLANCFHRSESADEYSAQLAVWCRAIKNLYPETQLLAVGHFKEWNATVLQDCSEWIDYLTLHYYFNSKIDGEELLDPQTTLFSAALVEANLKENIAVLEEGNRLYSRTGNPIRFSIDEWNNRHAVKTEDYFAFTRKDARRQYDVCAAASMLNVFLRNSPYVAMANYIFPVNGHGLIKTVGNESAYRSSLYYVFDLYRKYLSGSVATADVTGPGYKNVRLGDYAYVEGDIADETKSIVQDLCFVDAAACVGHDEVISVALVNRSYDKEQKVRLDLPEGYNVFEIWSVESEKVTASNNEEKPDMITSRVIKSKKTTVTVSPCGLSIVRCKR